MADEKKVVKRGSGPRTVSKANVREIDLGVLQREQGMVKIKGRSTIGRPLQGNPILSRSFRFRKSSSSNAIVTGDCIANLMFVGAGSVTAKRYFGDVRIRAVRLWSSQIANAAGANVSQIQCPPQLGADAYDQGPGEVFECVSSGPDKMGHVSIRPGVLTKLGRWINAGSGGAVSDIIFTISGQPGDVCEITLDYTLFSVTQQAGHSLTSSGVAAGYVYESNYLDNTSTSSTTGSQTYNSVSGWQNALVVG